MSRAQSNLEIATEFMKGFCERGGFGMKFVRRSCSYQGGVSNDGLILINSKLKNNIPKMLSVFFHEIAHVECRVNGTFPIYHGLKPKNQNNLSAKQLEKLRLAFLRTVVRAEKFVDKRAGALMKEYFPFLRLHPQNPTNSKAYWDFYKRRINKEFDTR